MVLNGPGHMRPVTSSAGSPRTQATNGHYPPILPELRGNLRENDGMIEGEGRPFFTTETSLTFLKHVRKQ